ncbi:hydantoinase B/oxoprolinase family protein [Rhodococcoides fascians]|uniref:hydantoinase B/oxoprolinase family protein n=1 Tax=Rhodococcoides fascians TaxID=1828 RepID=UPI000566C6E0|nr:hydantoinase B/oxoprolinase family protein [Rhodococcus fascians]
MSDLDMVHMAVIANRLDGIVREMENTLLRTGRSAVLNMARDFSCSIITGDNRLLSTAEGLPVHVIGTERLGQAMTDLHDDIADGDAYLHNDPYLGNTHAADHTILVPVFVDGVHLFTTAAKAHQADIGNSKPTTYMPYAKDVYEEGALIFPAVRIQRERRDVQDIIRMCRRRIRVPDQWYGDYLAMIGAARIGEASLKDLVDRYGIDTIKAFIEEWFDYSERKMVDAIGKLTEGTVTGHGTADPLEPIMPDGIPVQVTISVKPAEGRITLDLRDNIDCIDAGLNESETCSTNNVMTGLLNSLDPDIPRNSGSFRRIEVLLREGCIVGIPTFPHSTSVATTNLGERLVMTTQKTFADNWAGQGLAEGSCSVGAGFSVISGVDTRRGYRSPYINQVFLGSQGGPADATEDGWITYGNSVTNGLMFRDSIEMDEQKYPIRVEELRIRTDSEGAGQRRGAPGTILRFGPKTDRMTAFYATDGVVYPPRGVRGGTSAAPSEPFMTTVDGIEKDVPSIGDVVLEPGECLGHRLSGGGGYGNPHDREPERVRDDVLARFISFERAKTVYGVAFTSETLTADLDIDVEETARLRA